MFPYVEHPVLEIGSYPLQAFRVLALTAIVVEYTIVVRRAPRHGFTADQASSLVVWAVVLGMIPFTPQRMRVMFEYGRPGRNRFGPAPE